MNINSYKNKMAACSGFNYDNSDDNRDNAFVLSTFLEVVEAIPLAERWNFTPNAYDMLQTAANVARWMKDPENNHQLSAFCGALGGKLNLCLICRNGKFDKDTMWGLYHQLRTSDTFIRDWSQFLSLSCSNVCPFFYQHVTDAVFSKLIKHKVSQLSKEDTTEDDVNVALTPMEQNSLRYVCGYVCRKMSARIQSTTEEKDDLMHALMELAGDEVAEEGTEEWLNKVDRGGLWHVNDNAYNFFVALEFAAKKILKVQKDINEENYKTKLQASIEADEDIQLKWTLISTEMNEKAAITLFNDMVALFITIRGFAFTSACCEYFKQTHKTNLQKKKAIRKELS